MGRWNPSWKPSIEKGGWSRISKEKGSVGKDGCLCRSEWWLSLRRLECVGEEDFSRWRLGQLASSLQAGADPFQCAIYIGSAVLLSLLYSGRTWTGPAQDRCLHPIFHLPSSIFPAKTGNSQCIHDPARCFFRSAAADWSPFAAVHCICTISHRSGDCAVYSYAPVTWKNSRYMQQ